VNLAKKQRETLEKIRTVAPLIGIDPAWAAAVAMTESSLGMKQLSPTGCKGVFHMSMIAMRDLHQLMQLSDDDFADIACGMLFLRLLLKRWKTVEEATARFCDPKDREFYVDRVREYTMVFRDHP
jgi:membrane-bound lytic murein transglycosylase MltF